MSPRKPSELSLYESERFQGDMPGRLDRKCFNIIIAPRRYVTTETVRPKGAVSRGTYQAGAILKAFFESNLPNHPCSELIHHRSSGSFIVNSFS